MNNFIKSKKAHLKLGKYGEKIACRFLKNKVYEVFLKNYKVKNGEIDIIARDGETICFVEVKTRSYSKVKVVENKVLVSDKQIKRIQKASKDYLYEIGNPKVKYRYELVEIFVSKLGVKTLFHWKNNFGK
jgi:putative endonuclease